MSDLYAPPGAELDSPPVRRGQENITPKMVESLRSTRPWVMFLSVLGFLSAALMIGLGLMIGGVGLMGDSGVMGEAFGEMGGVQVWMMGAIYLVLGIIYGLGSFYLIRYAICIGRMGPGGGVEAMEQALEAQKKFWRLLGAMVAFFVVLYLLIMAGVVVFAIMAASQG